ncbi:MAG: hypothetical protein NUV34_02985, partial [Sulfuricaulis sp.]|nr:hypothetical protein [Sulfuricaulis sp.]
MSELTDIVDPTSLGLGLDPTDFSGANQADLAMETPALGLSGAQGLNLGGPAAAPVGAPAAALPTMAAQVSPRTTSDQDFLSGLPTGAKLGLAMQEFAAAFHGRASPIEQMLESKRKRDKENRDTLVSNVNVLQKGTEILRKLPQGSLQRQAVAEELGKIVGPKFAPLFAAVGSDKEDALKNYLDILGDKDVQAMAVKQCSNASDFGACIQKLSTDDSWGKKAETVVDSKRFAQITQTMRVLAEQFAKAGKEKFTLADITQANQGGELFSFEEMQTIKRNEAYWGGMGLQSAKTIEAANQAAAKLAERSPAERMPGSIVVGETRYQFDPENKVEGGKRLATDQRYVAMGPAGKPKSNELTEAQMAKLRREKAAYDNAQKQLTAFGIDSSGKSTKPAVQDRLTANKPMAPGSPVALPNPSYDRTFEGRVKAWLKATEAGDPYEREG